jgi:hypothetical protein
MAGYKIGWIGIAIVTFGAAVAGVGAWYVVHARPHVGDVIDTFSLDDGRTLLVRAEQGGDRAFLELRKGEEVVWQALIPHYAGAHGRSGIAWCPTVVTARVERDGRAEVFALSLKDSAKVGSFRIAVEHEPIQTQPTGPITLTDHERSYEIVGGRDWHELVAVDLTSGKGLWKAELGPAPVDEGAAIRCTHRERRKRPRRFCYSRFQLVVIQLYSAPFAPRAV